MNRAQPDRVPRLSRRESRRALLPTDSAECSVRARLGDAARSTDGYATEAHANLRFCVGLYG